MSNGIQEPQTEISVKFEGREIAVVAFFPDAAGGTDVVCGVENAAAVEIVASLFQQAAIALSACFGAGSTSPDRGDVSRVEKGADPYPF